MTNLLDIGRWLPPARDFFGILLDAGLKSAAVLAAAGVAVVCMGRRSAAARHLVCFLAVASLPALPVLSWALPGWRVLPGWMALREPSRQSIPSAPSTIPPARRPIETALPAAPEITTPKQVAPAAAPGREPPRIQIVAPSKPPPARAGMEGWRAGLLAWLAGVMLALAPAVLGVLSLHRLERASRRETAASWLDLLAQLCTHLGFQRRVVLLKAAQRRMPMTWGVLRPKVLLPEESREWPPERRGVVLLHELAHAKRCDYLTLMVTRLVCALYWFNPLVWLAARRMVAERERACDDIVLRHGAKPAEYAEQVLEISAGRSPGWLANCGGVAMARPSNLESRLLAILDTNRNRAAVTRWAALSALLLLTAIVVPVAMLKAAPSPQSANSQSAIHNPVASQITASNEAPAPVAFPWGVSVDGVSVQLRSDHLAWNLDDVVTLKASARNQGPGDFSMAPVQEVGELEVDGIWYQWAGIIDIKSSWFPPGRQYDFQIAFTTNWQTKDGQHLRLTPGRHTVRFVVMANPADRANGNAPIRAVSNPVQIDASPGVGDRADHAPENPPSDWGEPVNGLRTRLVAEKLKFRAGEPIRVRIEVTNISNQTISFQDPVAPYFKSSLIALDAEGKAPPFIGESGQFMAWVTNVAPGQTLQLEPFDLTEQRYLRRPGSYTVQLPAEPFPMRMPGFSLPGLPRSGRLTFEVVADAAADADGDPVGRLLSLLPEKWSLENHGNKIGPWRPGGNRVEATGRALTLYGPTGSRMIANSGAIWLWLTEKPAAEQEDQLADTTPASEYLGQAGRFIIYISADATALKDWPTAKEDILRALKSLAVNFDMTPGWGDPVEGFQVRVRAAADAGAGEAWSQLLVDITNQGPRRVLSTTNSFTWQVQVDGHWYVSKDYARRAAMLLDVVPGQAWTNLPLDLDSPWRLAGPEEVTTQMFSSWVVSYPDNPLMKIPPGKHTVRVAVVAGPHPVRAVSNPVKVGVPTNAPSTAAPARVPKSPEAILAELRGIVPEDWTCHLILKPGGTEATLPLVNEPLFEIDFTNFNISLAKYDFGGWPPPPHPGLRLYFVPAAEKAWVQRGTNGIWNISRLATIAVAETPDYLVVTSFRNINDAAFGTVLGQSIAPLGFALEKYFGKLADKDAGDVLGMTAENSEGLTTGSGFAGQVVDDQTGKPVPEFSLEYVEADAATAEPIRPNGAIYFGGRFMLQFWQTNSGWEALEPYGRGPSFRGRTVWVTGQKVQPRIRADGYLTAPLTPEPVVWPVKLTNLVVRLQRAGASAQPAAQPGGAKPE